MNIQPTIRRAIETSQGGWFTAAAFHPCMVSRGRLSRPLLPRPARRAAGCVLDPAILPELVRDAENLEKTSHTEVFVRTMRLRSRRHHCRDLPDNVQECLDNTGTEQ